LPVSNLRAGHHNYECHYVGCLSGVINDDDEMMMMMIIIIIIIVHV